MLRQYLADWRQWLQTGFCGMFKKEYLLIIGVSHFNFRIHFEFYDIFGLTNLILDSEIIRY